MESILGSFIKYKMYLRVTAFTEYCMDHKLVPVVVLAHFSSMHALFSRAVFTIKLRST